MKWGKILRAAVPQDVDNPGEKWAVSMAPGFAVSSGRAVDAGAFGRCTRDQLVWRAAAEDPGSAVGLVESGAGPLLERGSGDAIEVWTDCELSALHALWRAMLRGADVRDRVERGCAWLIEEIQPDNATNRPWGVGAFAQIGIETGNYEAVLYAETLLHNYQASEARGDALCASILLDGAAGLELASGSA